MKETFAKRKRIAIIGSALSGGAAQVIDALLRSGNQVPIAVFDSNPSAKGKTILGVSVIGSTNDVINSFHAGTFDEAVIAIGSLEPRKEVFDMLSRALIPFCNVIDKDAVVSDSAKLGIGNVLLCHAYLGPGVVIGDNCYIISGSRINHDSQLGSHCYLSTGVSIAGRVVVGNMVKFDTSSGAAPDCSIPCGSYLVPGQIATTQSFPSEKCILFNCVQNLCD